MRYTYTGEIVPKFIPVSFYEGYMDALKYNMKDVLYRYPLYKVILWWIGNQLGRVNNNSKGVIQ